MKTHDVCKAKRKTATRRTVQTPSMIQIEPSECGSVALGIVLAHYGRWVSLEELRAACGVSRNGSQGANLLQSARSYGLMAQAFKAEPHQLSRLLPPLVLHWNFSHFVVFEGFTRKGRARINDPAMGRRTISAAELDESMTGVVLSFRRDQASNAEVTGRPCFELFAKDFKRPHRVSLMSLFSVLRCWSPAC
jgi:ABC-type bacteriocin/lantibiotic exporter with double-glycine peptidase domain